MRKIGVIGGMGPQATVDLINKVIAATPASCDQEHIPLLVDIVPQVPDRTAYLLGKGKTPLPMMLESSARLVDSGVDALCMPCNTAHAFADKLQAQLGIPFLSIIESTVEKLTQASRVAVLATPGTYRCGVYDRALDAAGLQSLVIKPAIQKQIADAIYKVKAGRMREAAQPLQYAVNTLCESRVDVLVAACTELPLLMPSIVTDIAVIDATQALAEKIVAFAHEGGT
jgi:aspartate racemase